VRLSNSIEEFIKSLLRDSNGPVELQRNELAVYFQCAPSQINYVLATRFNTEQGYIIESRRGGGGYIRIIPVIMEPEDTLLYLVSQQLNRKALTRDGAVRLVIQLQEQGIVTPAQATLLDAATSDQALSMPAQVTGQMGSLRDLLRAQVLRYMLMAIMREQKPQEEE